MANDISAWLAKLEGLTAEQLAAAGITVEDIAAAKKEHLLERDYTQKSQRVAALQKIQDQYPDLNPDEAAKLYGWWQQNGAAVNELWAKRDKLVERPEPNAEPRPAGQKRKWRDAEAADLYETASLRAIFEDLQTDTAEATYQRWQKDYQEKEVPRLDRVAGGYLDTVVGLLDFGLEDAVLASRDPKHQRADLNEIIKQAALRGTPGQRADFRKVAADWRAERAAALKPVEDDAFKRGLEEGRKTAEGPSGPLGGARPGIRPDMTEPAPKSRDELFQRIVSSVEQKSGRPVPL